jgi:hypothetical protein
VNFARLNNNPEFLPASIVIEENIIIIFKFDNDNQKIQKNNGSQNVAKDIIKKKNNIK